MQKNEATNPIPGKVMSAKSIRAYFRRAEPVSGSAVDVSRLD